MFQWGIVDGNDPTLYAVKLKTYFIRGVFENVRSKFNNKRNVFVRIPKFIMK